MDEFVRGLEILLEADAGRLMFVVGAVVVVGMGILSYMLLRALTRSLDATRADAEREDKRLEAQTQVQVQSNTVLLEFTSSVKESTGKMSEAVSALTALIPAVNTLIDNTQRSFEQRALEHERMEATSAEVARLVSTVLDEIRAMPSIISKQMRSDVNCELIIKQLQALEENLIVSLTAVFEQYHNGNEGDLS